MSQFLGHNYNLNDLQIKELRIDFSILVWTINENRILENCKTIDFLRADLVDYRKID